MIHFSEAGICLKNLGRPVLLLHNIRVNISLSCLVFKVQQLGTSLLLGLGLDLYRFYRTL